MTENLDNDLEKETIDDEEKVEKKEVEDEKKSFLTKIKRIPWREFIRNQFKKLVGFLIMLIMMLIIISLSNDVSGGSDEINPDNIISSSSNNDLLLIFLSSSLFLIVLAFFTKVVFIDHKFEFGIENWKSQRAFWFFLLTISFILLVYILLDIALVNVYLITGPALVMWSLESAVGSSIPFSIPVDTDRLAYSEIRGLYFTAMYVFILLFPLVMFMVILSRYGRNKISERREQPKTPYTLKRFIKFILVIPLELILLSIFAAVNSSSLPPIISIVIIFSMLVVGFWWLLQLLTLIFRVLKFTAFITYSNILIIVPIIFLFYLLPAILWGSWDLIYILRTGGLDNTIYNTDFASTESMRIDPNTEDIGGLGWQDFLIFYLQTIYYNLGSLIRIVELDFVIIVGLSAVVIGFAEGYSIVAIFRSLSRGVSIARSGRIASQSAPRMIVITSRLIYILAWLALLWDKFLVLWEISIEELNFDLPFIDVPRVFVPVYDLSINIEGLGGIFIPLAILLVPFYFIITSSFKFLSVSLVAEKTKHDAQIFFLLISSAFILIISKILADITALPDFEKTISEGGQKDFLPLSGETTENILPFAAKLFEFSEAIGFYAGVVFSIFLLLKTWFNKIRGVHVEEEIVFED